MLTITELTDRITFDAKNEQKDVFKEVKLRLQKVMAGNSQLSYREAVHCVFRDDEDLHRLFLDSVPPVHQQGGN